MTTKGPVVILDQGEVLGGAQLHALAVARVLATRGWDVGVLASEQAAARYRDHVQNEATLELRAARMPRLQPVGVGTPGRALATAARIRSALRAGDARLVQANTVRTQVAGTLAAASAGIPVVWMIHDFLFPPRLLGYLLPMVERVIAVSDGLAEFLAGSVSSSQAAKIVVIPNGIDVDRAGRAVPADTVRDLTGGPFGFREDRRYVGIVGHLHPRKGQDLLVEAAAEIVRDPPPGPPVEFLVVGDVIDHEADSAPFLSDLRRTCEERGIGSEVAFLGWQDDVPSILKRLDVLVSASRVPEGFGRTVLEGLATGVPVVAADLGEPGRMIRHGENGLLFEPGDPVSLAESIRRLLDGGPLARRLASAGRETVQDDLSLRSVSTRVEEVWLDAMGTSR